ncbi:hypothetical protein BHE74_00007991 [Ensete ventricosum]|nr:hypothetical protein GW17_00014138 [Ensete ventricosum]RWW83500.1 hypothetical protein BHE74_00007991 [Ensete ventricosum]RZR76714.1 hypothetical protein BHM03_00001592 [Ensete ventricosum]
MNQTVLRFVATEPQNAYHGMGSKDCDTTVVAERHEVVAAGRASAWGECSIPNCHLKRAAGGGVVGGWCSGRRREGVEEACSSSKKSGVGRSLEGGRELSRRLASDASLLRL